MQDLAAIYPAANLGCSDDRIGHVDRIRSAGGIAIVTLEMARS